MELREFVDLLLSLTSGVVLPIFLALLTSGIAVATVVVSLRHSNQLQRAERRAGEAARRAEAYRGAAEKVMESLSQFVSFDPATEDMRGSMRELRSRVMIFQTLTHSESQDRLGLWLALECPHGLQLFGRALEGSSYNQVLKPGFAAALEPPHRWAADTLMTLSKALRPPVDDAWVSRRIETLIAAEVRPA